MEGEVARYANIGKLSHTAPGVVRVETFGQKLILDSREIIGAA